MSDVESYISTSEQYFKLVDDLLRSYKEESSLKRSKPQWFELLHELFSLIIKLPVTETSPSASPDMALNGLLNLSTTSLKANY